jgi:hypothetical protein
MTRTASLLIVCVAGLAACGGASPSPQEPVEPPSICEVDPAMAEKRRPKPEHPGCMDQAKLDAMEVACNDGDATACYLGAACILADQLGKDPDAEAARNARMALRVSCDGGIAEACELRVSVAMQHGEALPDDGCADLIAGCHLGDEMACLSCTTQDCG